MRKQPREFCRTWDVSASLPAVPWAFAVLIRTQSPRFSKPKPVHFTCSLQPESSRRTERHKKEIEGNFGTPLLFPACLIVRRFHLLVVAFITETGNWWISFLINSRRAALATLGPKVRVKLCLIRGVVGGREDGSRSQKVHSPNFLTDKYISKVVRISSMIIFYLSKLWKAKFSIQFDVILLVRLQGKFDIDHSWEWKG